MKYWSMALYRYILGVITICCLSPLALAQVWEEPSPSGLFVVPQDQTAIVTNEDQIRVYLNRNSQDYGWVISDKHLKLTRVKTSLVARHYYFQQHINDIPVDRAEIIVSVNNNTQRIQKIYNGLAPVPDAFIKSILNQARAIQSEEIVLQRVWATKPHDSQLIAQPNHRLVYAFYKGTYRLVYRITMPVSKEEGNWEYTLDATTGEILLVERLDTPAKPSSSFERFKLPGPLSKANTPASLAAELQRIEKRKLIKLQKNQKMMKANGSGYVFDPDPRTALHNEALEHNSPAEAFENAYIRKNLLDIKFLDNQYYLDGPWVSIQELDDPHDEPSTTVDGNWVAKRGDDGFLDVMAYFHLDQNQRYIQSLGFTGEKGIQEGAIEVDTNGFGGEHNAYYNEFLNEIVLGKADDCTPMAEDADVILHEYGHAIHASINPNWHGGDTGAIGEGFADYWAASYSLSTANGADFYPERAAQWAGFNDCWEGRFLNRTEIRYDPLRTYQAHESIDDYWSDELWATPLFQSLLALREQGVPREEVDRIILESHFGLGVGVSIRDLALATVIAAKNLYPDGPHAKVFREKFESMNILSPPLSFDVMEIIGGGAEELLLPGSQLALYPGVKNLSWKSPFVADVEIVSISDNAEIQGDVVQPVSVNFGKTQAAKFAIQIKNDALCGANINTEYQLRYQDPDTGQLLSANKHYSSLVGAPVIQEFTSRPNALIPGGDKVLELELEVDGLSILGKHFQVYLDIRDDLWSAPQIVLRSPAGTRVALPLTIEWQFTTQGYFPGDFGVDSLFEPFYGEDPTGTWVLEVSDPEHENTSIVKQWGIKTIVAAECNLTPNQDELILKSVTTMVSGDKTKERVVDPGDSVDLFVKVANESTHDLENIEVKLEATDNTEWDISPFSQEKLAALSGAEARFSFHVPADYGCGKPLPFRVVSSYLAEGEEREVNTPMDFFVGHELDLPSISLTTYPIPDNDGTSVSSTAYASNLSPIDFRSFSIFLYLEHPVPNELKITLRSPEGVEVVLRDRDSQESYINGTFPDEYTATGDLSVLNGTNPNGTWELEVQDTKTGNEGTLYSWGINGSGGFSCNSNFANPSPTAVVVSKQLEVEEGKTISLDASNSTDDDISSLKFKWVQYDGPDVALSATNQAKVEFKAPLVTSLRNYTYEVTVTDYFGNSDTAEVRILVKDIPTGTTNPPPRRRGGGGGVSYGLVLLLVLFSGRLLHSKRH